MLLAEVTGGTRSETHYRGNTGGPGGGNGNWFGGSYTRIEYSLMEGIQPSG